VLESHPLEIARQLSLDAHTVFARVMPVRVLVACVCQQQHILLTHTCRFCNISHCVIVSHITLARTQGEFMKRAWLKEDVEYRKKFCPHIVAIGREWWCACVLH
jgi:hypothetical protein